MSLQQNKAVVRRFVEVVQNQHNLEALDEIFSQDFVDYGGMTNPPDIEGARAFFAANYAAFPDQHFTIHMQLAEGDKVMTYKTLHGTHEGEFLGFPATGNKVAFDIIDIFTVVDGMITEHRLVADKLTMMQQLGALPSELVDLKGQQDLVDAAKAAGVEHFVLVSIRGADPDSPIPFARFKFGAEQHLRDSGLSYTILQPSAFMGFHTYEMIGKPIVETGKVRLFPGEPCAQGRAAHHVGHSPSFPSRLQPGDGFRSLLRYSRRSLRYRADAGTLSCAVDRFGGLCSRAVG